MRTLELTKIPHRRQGTRADFRRSTAPEWVLVRGGGVAGKHETLSGIRFWGFSEPVASPPGFCRPVHGPLPPPCRPAVDGGSPGTRAVGFEPRRRGFSRWGLEPSGARPTPTHLGNSGSGPASSSSNPR